MVEDDQIYVMVGDVIGIHYPENTEDDEAIVPYYTQDDTLPAGLTTQDLSAVIYEPWTHNLYAVGRKTSTVSKKERASPAIQAIVLESRLI